MNYHQTKHNGVPVLINENSILKKEKRGINRNYFCRRALGACPFCFLKNRERWA